MPVPERVQVYKTESTADGGQDAQSYPFPAGINPQQDALESAGLYIQDGSNRDYAVLIKRVGNDMVFVDPSSGTLTLSQLNVGGGGGVSEAQHRVLRHLIHFIDSGPAEGFVSGAYREMLPSASAFPTSEIWWTSAAKTHKIVELTITRNGNKTPATEEWKMYDTDGTTVLATVTDTLSYTGVFETSRTRAIT